MLITGGNRYIGMFYYIIWIYLCAYRFKDFNIIVRKNKLLFIVIQSIYGRSVKPYYNMCIVFNAFFF